MIAIGHSLGGGTLARVAEHDPSLFAGLILVDPIIVPEYPECRRESEKQRYDRLIKGALSRRPVWPSMEEAKASFRSPFFSTWDRSVLEAYVDTGLTEHPSGEGVMLKQAPYDEAAVFTEPRAPAEVYSLLPTLPDSIPLKFIMSGKGASATGGEEQTAHIVWRRPTNCENVRIPTAGHLIPQEDPSALAREIAEFLGKLVPKLHAGNEAMKARL